MLEVEERSELTGDFDTRGTATADDDGFGGGDFAMEGVQRIGGFQVRTVQREEVTVGRCTGCDDQGVVWKSLNLRQRRGRSVPVESFAAALREEVVAPFLGFEIEALDLDTAIRGVEVDRFALDNGVVVATVAGEAGLDRDQIVFVLNETAFDKSTWSANVPVNVSRRTDNDQAVCLNRGRCAKSIDGVVQKVVGARETTERSAKNDDVQWLLAGSWTGIRARLV